MDAAQTQTETQPETSPDGLEFIGGHVADDLRACEPGDEIILNERSSTLSVQSVNVHTDRLALNCTSHGYSYVVYVHKSESYAAVHRTETLRASRKRFDITFLGVVQTPDETETESRTLEDEEIHDLESGDTVRVTYESNRANAERSQTYVGTVTSVETDVYDGIRFTDVSLAQGDDLPRRMLDIVADTCPTLRYRRATPYGPEWERLSRSTTVTVELLDTETDAQTETDADAETELVTDGGTDRAEFHDETADGEATHVVAKRDADGHVCDVYALDDEETVDALERTYSLLSDMSASVYDLPSEPVSVDPIMFSGDHGVGKSDPTIREPNPFKAPADVPGSFPCSNCGGRAVYVETRTVNHWINEASAYDSHEYECADCGLGGSITETGSRSGVVASPPPSDDDRELFGGGSR